MRKIIFSTVFVMIAAVAAIVPVFAKDRTTMTDEHIEHIKANCRVALATLGRIHANDAPQYINSNQIYFSVGDKLMARLNSRLTLNQYDASDLVKTTSDYDEALKKFRMIYKAYDDTMSELVRMDCQRTPVTFYDRVAVAREQRAVVHDTVVELQELIAQYREQVEEFKEKHFTGASDE